MHPCPSFSLCTITTVPVAIPVRRPAYRYQTALSSGYYAPYYNTPDDGTAIFTALTKCDRYSWCSGLRDDNLTMTRESWHQGSP